MFNHSLNHEVDRKTVFHWFLLAFLSGNVNAGGYLSSHRFVTHLTGFSTLFGVDVADGRLDQAIGILSVPLFFLGGTVVSAYLIDRPQRRGRRAHYSSVMVIVSCCLILVGSLGDLGTFGPFGEVLRLRMDYFLLALLCLASGLQNAAITISSRGTVRSTHLTGPTTDLGIGLVRAWTMRFNSAERRAEVKIVRLRLGMIGSFILGSLVGAILFIKVSYTGFYLPAVIASYMALIAWKQRPVLETVLPARAKLS